jgi:hypothetical protein
LQTLYALFFTFIPGVVSGRGQTAACEERGWRGPQQMSQLVARTYALRLELGFRGLGHRVE